MCMQLRRLNARSLRISTSGIYVLAIYTGEADTPLRRVAVRVTMLVCNPSPQQDFSLSA